MHEDDDESEVGDTETPFVSFYDALFDEKGELVFTRTKGEGKATDEMNAQEEKKESLHEPPQDAVANSWGEQTKVSVVCGLASKPQAQTNSEGQPIPRVSEEVLSAQSSAVRLEEEEEEDPHAQLRALLAEDEDDQDPLEESHNNNNDVTPTPTPEPPEKTKCCLKAIMLRVMAKLKKVFAKKPKPNPEKLKILQEEFLDKYVSKLLSPLLFVCLSF